MMESNHTHENSLRCSSDSELMSHDTTPTLPFEIDRFLLSALATPKDRLTILKLEQDVEKFIKDPRRSIMEFPPMTSYQRLIVHRVAQYYRLEHAVLELDGLRRTIMLTKTSESIIPILKFSDLVEHQDAPEPPAKVKIMRRQNVTENSKESSEKTTHRGIHKDKSLEEREEEYAKARARIFGREEEETTTTTTSETNNVTPNSPSPLPQINNDEQKVKKKLADNEFMDFYRGTDNWGVIWNRTHQPPYPGYDPMSDPYLMQRPPVGWQGAYPMYAYPTPVPEMVPRPQYARGPGNIPGKEKRAYSNPPPQFYQNRPMPVYRYPNNPHDDTMWAYYASPYQQMVPMVPTVPMYSRPPPKSTELFDPNSNTSNKPIIINKNNNIPNVPIIIDDARHPHFKRSPSHDSFFTSTTKGPSESVSDPSSLNQDDLKPPVPTHLEHIVEIIGQVGEKENGELKQLGGTIKSLETGEVIVVFKNSSAARNAMEKFKSVNVKLQPWRIPLASYPPNSIIQDSSGVNTTTTTTIDDVQNDANKL